MSADVHDLKGISESQVLEFLRKDPEFFLRHESELARLRLPHTTGGTVSLIEHQVAILRERNMTMRRRMNELMQAARDNDNLFAKTRSLTLALLDVDTWHELNEVLATTMLVDFEADYVCCHVNGCQVRLDHILSHDGKMPHERFVSSSAPLCTTLRNDEMKLLFPLSEHNDHGSAVLLPLLLTESEGCLAIGAKSPDRFSSDMDTLFVTYIADVLARVIDRL